MEIVSYSDLLITAGFQESACVHYFLGIYSFEHLKARGNVSHVVGGNVT